ncbi:MAG: hypothetical protein GC181_09645 [Bacteroidetes bacterium]|nr:hypothetical protein [Bacteroidota bacterium]
MVGEDSAERDVIEINTLNSRMLTSLDAYRILHSLLIYFRVEVLNIFTNKPMNSNKISLPEYEDLIGLYAELYDLPTESSDIEIGETPVIADERPVPVYLVVVGDKNFKKDNELGFLLINITKAIHLNPDEVFIHQGDLSHALSLIRTDGLKLILVFNSDSGSQNLYTVSKNEDIGTSQINSPFLQDLENDRNQKVKLWSLLKTVSL